MKKGQKITEKYQTTAKQRDTTRQKIIRQETAGQKILSRLRKPRVRRQHKDTVFRMLFHDKKNLLSLYNAVNQTAYTDADDLKITTLENAIYMNYKNDVSFVFGFELMLYEHQSTVNPNMPLRDLTYVTTILQGMTREENLYGSEQVRIPAPKFVVFYNGTYRQPARQVLRLSDAFLKRQEKPELELLVTVYNINLGYNKELMKACRLLEEYAQYVNQVREFASGLPFEEAVEKAVDHCIQNNILADFLSKNRAEAIVVSIFEYDEEKHMRSEREAGIRQGLKQGMELGKKEGIEKGLEQGVQALVETSIEFGSSKQETVERLMKKLKLTQERAEEGVEKYWH